MKKACIISCSNHYQARLHIFDEYLKSIGYSTTYITSDFDHTAKTEFVCTVPAAKQIHARPYKKNMSLDRIMSHKAFAMDVLEYLESLPESPDVLVVSVPPNFLAHYTAKYKKKHPETVLIYDIFDMWPETFPFQKLKTLLSPVFSVWAWLRNHALPAADHIITECDLFRELLKLPDERGSTVYLCAEPMDTDSTAKLREDALELCYLGAINNIIDIPVICELISRLSRKKPVVLHIIGKGERERELIEGAKSAGAEVIYYGAVYDEEEKHSIMHRCHFGLNIMKSSVCIGLTMKSLDYFRHGLPIINNIPADTQRFVTHASIGVQLDADCVEKIVSFTSADYAEMRKNVNDVFKNNFSRDTVFKKIGQIFRRVIGEGYA